MIPINTPAADTQMFVRFEINTAAKDGTLTHLQSFLIPQFLGVPRDRLDEWVLEAQGNMAAFARAASLFHVVVGDG